MALAAVWAFAAAGELSASDSAFVVEDQATAVRVSTGEAAGVARQGTAPVADEAWPFPDMSPDSAGEDWTSHEVEWVPRFWVRPEYLLWFTKGMELPALVTTSPENTPQDEAGVLTVNGTEVLYGNEQVAHKARSGGRLTLGYWFDEFQECGLMASGFAVSNDQNSGTFFAESSGIPLLSRPFYNVETNQEDAELVAYPDILSGAVSVASSGELQSGAIALRRTRWLNYGSRFDCLLGYRFFRLREGLQIDENLVSTNPGGLVQQGTTIDLFDRFNTNNDFHGAELGFCYETDNGPWTLEVLGKVALGTMFETIAIDGETVVTTPGDAPVTSAGGLLALPTNMGTHSGDHFCVLPELNVNLHLWLTERVQATFGYTGIYVSNVVRAADQIDGSVDPRQLGGGVAVIDRPAVLFRTADFWAQGANFGIECLW